MAIIPALLFTGEVEVDLHTLQRNEVVKINSQLNKSCRRKNLRGEIQLTLTFNPVGQILRVTVNQVSKPLLLIVKQIGIPSISNAMRQVLGAACTGTH